MHLYADNRQNDAGAWNALALRRYIACGTDSGVTCGIAASHLLYNEQLLRHSACAVYLTRWRYRGLLYSGRHCYRGTAGKNATLYAGQQRDFHWAARMLTRLISRVNVYVYHLAWTKIYICGRITSCDSRIAPLNNDEHHHL